MRIPDPQINRLLTIGGGRPAAARPFRIPAFDNRTAGRPGLQSATVPSCQAPRN